jgi:surface antigen
MTSKTAWANQNTCANQNKPGVKAMMAAALAALLLGGMAIATPAAADPPSWAPAHGYRAGQDDQGDRRKGKHWKKHKHAHHHYDAPYRTVTLPQPVFVDRGPDLACDRGALSGNKSLVGQILGGVGGAVLGSQFGQGTGKLAATAGGTLIGVLIGGGIGGSLDAADAACAQHALEAAPNGTSVTWVDPNQDTRYAVTPIDTFRNDQGRYCRSYSTSAQIGLRTREVQGVACRDAAGGWQIQS